MKKILIALLSVIPAIISSAQSYEGTITYNKQKQQAIIIDYAYPPEAVENAVVQKIAQMGYKGKTEKGIFNRDKGFIVFESAFINDISDNSMDYIIKVERKSRKEKDEATLYLVMNKDGENAMPSLASLDIGKAKSFLNNLLPEIEVANLELQIKAQEEAVSKAEKKFKDLQDDQQKLEKKIRNLQEDLENNGKNQENQQKEIEAQKQALEALRAKRTPAL